MSYLQSVSTIDENVVICMLCTYVGKYYYVPTRMFVDIIAYLFYLVTFKISMGTTRYLNL